MFLLCYFLLLGLLLYREGVKVYVVYLFGMRIWKIWDQGYKVDIEVSCYFIIRYFKRVIDIIGVCSIGVLRKNKVYIIKWVFFYMVQKQGEREILYYVMDGQFRVYVMFIVCFLVYSGERGSLLIWDF